MKDVQFEQTRKSLQSKQRGLKLKGIGNKPNASAALWGRYSSSVWKRSLGKFHGRSAFKPVWFNNTIHFGILGCKKYREMCSRGDLKLCQNFHRAGVPRIHWKRNQNSFRKRSMECKSHCTENFCCAERPGMSSKGLQSLRRKATRGNEIRRPDALFYFGSK